ncbi:MAG: plastocyanin/azurin family copper-binding protein [Nitrosopumilaceae archaeon]
MAPVTSYQEELETIENTESTPIEKIVRIMGTEENSVSPNSIYVRTFDVVTFVNLDSTNGAAHTVVSVKTGTTEPDGTFDSGLIRTGENFKVTLTEPGIYEYFDPIFPSIRGTIHVV